MKKSEIYREAQYAVVEYIQNPQRKLEILRELLDRVVFERFVEAEEEKKDGARQDEI
ncbi:MAG: hypothetical protein KH321_11220 [Clostridium sp.]|nr:hypothetical protein [Clostridium sp.]